MDSGAIGWGPAMRAACIALLVVLLAPASASAVAQNLSEVRFSCGYDAGSNTMRPTITVVRDRSESAEVRIRVSFRLKVDGARTASLGAGPVDPDSDTVTPGTGRAVTGEPIAMRAPSGVAFGDGGVGGAALDPDGHTYIVEVEVFDFDAGDNVLYYHPCLGDADLDGLQDDWEQAGIERSDGTIEVDLPAMGAKPFRRDVFVELDSMPGYRLSDTALRDVASAFAAAPVSNPDGTVGISLHVDNGPGSQMAPGKTWGALSEAGALPFDSMLGTGSTRFDWATYADPLKTEHMGPGRRFAFHYAMSIRAFDTAGHSGLSRTGGGGVEPSSDFLVSLLDECKGADPCGAARNDQAGTFMHELGHNLGLRHGGDDDDIHKPNYLSIMNYSFQRGGLLGPGRAVDFSRFVLPGLDENAINESAGIGTAAAAYQTVVACPAGTPDEDPRWRPRLDGPVDFNCDGDATDSGFAWNTNRDPFLSFLRPSWVDWHHLVLDGGEVGGLGAGETMPATTEVDEGDPDELRAALEHLVPPPGATSGAASETTPGSALLAGVVRRNDEPAEFSFEIGDAAGAYTRETDREPVPNGTGAAPVSTRVRGLAPDHLYHYRAVAHTDRHVVPGADRTFRTPAGDVEPPPPDAPDPTFGENAGWTRLFLGEGFSHFTSLARSSDGRLIAVGEAAVADGGENRGTWAIARLLPGGTPDPAFGDGGVVYPRIGSGAAGARDVEILPDGRFVVAGFAIDDRAGLDRYSLAVARFHPDGTPDDGFGVGGQVVYPVGEDSTTGAAAVERLADGRLIVAGQVRENVSDFRAVAIRLGPDGAVDTTYGDDGVGRISLGTSGSVTDARLQNDGKLVFGGIGTTGTGQQALALARLMPDGEPDADFGFEGLALGPPGAQFGGAVAVAADGKLLLAGSEADHPFVVARFTTGGQPDATFSGDGRATPFTGEVSAQSLLARPDGSVLVGGGAGGRGFSLVHLNANGTADADFGDGGRAYLTEGGTCDDFGCPFSYQLGAANALVALPDGRVAAAGPLRTGGRGERTGGAVARFGTPPDSGGGTPGEENGLPVARLRASDARPRRGETITLSAAGSTDPEGRLTRFEYDLDGDGTFELDGGDFGDRQTTSYATVGEKRPRVRVTDAAGATDVATAELEVVNVAPVPDLQLGGDGPLVHGRPMHLFAVANDPDAAGDAPLTVNWDLDGDGTFEHPGGTAMDGGTLELDRTPTAAGVQSVAVQMLDADGGSGVARLRLDVQENRPPRVQLIPSDERVKSGTEVTFEAVGEDPDSDNGSVRLSWDPEGDGTYGPEGTSFLPASTTIQTSGTGNRTVGVRLRDEVSTVVARATIAVVANAPPTAVLAVSPASPTTGDFVELDASDSDDADGFVTGYKWDLDGDGAYERDTGPTPSVSLVAGAPGTQTVRLQVTDDGGATATATQTFEVRPRQDGGGDDGGGDDGGGGGGTGGGGGGSGGGGGGTGGGGTGGGGGGGTGATPTTIVVPASSRKPRAAGKLAAIKIKLRVVGPGGKGTVQLRAPKRDRKAGVKRNALLGKGSFAIADNGTRVAKLKLTKLAKRVLRRTGRLKTKARFTVAASGGPATLTVPVTIRMKARKR